MYIGIDLGTSGVKALLIDEQQRIVGSATSRPLDVTRPKLGWSEQDPQLWWDAVCETMDQFLLSNRGELARVRGIGLSGQMYGATCLDEQDRPLRPAILWNDSRSALECREMEERAPDLRQIAGRRATPGVTAPKLAWLYKHEPDIFRKTRTVLLPKDYVRMLLTGDKVSDMADASGSLWLDLSGRNWSDKLLACTHMDRSYMPRLVEGTEVSGTLRQTLARRWGMQQAPVIAGGGGDNACGACGSGVIQPGIGTVSLGTSGVLFVASHEPRISKDYDIESLCHSVPGVWHQMSVILSATSCLNWLSKRLKRPAAELVAALGSAPLQASNLLFLPFLDGCWSPQNDASMQGAFVGLNHATDDTAMTQAVLQGVVFAMAEAAQGFRANGAEFKELLALGGGSRSGVWMSMLADSLEVEIAVPAGSELGAAYGAARLGLIAATGAKPETVLTRPPIAQRIVPDAERVQAYRKAFSRWHDLYRPVRAACGAFPNSM